MTGPEHYREAEAHLASAAQNFMRGDDPTSALAAAQVHATLALAAATALAQPIAGMPDEPGYSQDEYDDWYEAVEIGDTAKGGAADA